MCVVMDRYAVVFMIAWFAVVLTSGCHSVWYLALVGKEEEKERKEVTGCAACTVLDIADQQN